MTLDEFAQRLDSPKSFKYQGKNGYRCKCPAHDDKHASMAAWLGDDGWIKVRCQAGCTEEAILWALGLESKDRRTDRAIENEEIVYRYTDAEGKYLFEKVRRVKPDGSKTFIQRIWDGNEFTYGLKSLGNESSTLYRLPELLKAIKEGKTVYICEGEKAVDRMYRAGAAATCQPRGADKNRPEGNWLVWHTAIFRGANAIVVADIDEVGEAYAKYVAAQLTGLCASVSVVQSKTGQPKHDSYDHLNAGYSLEEFVPRPDLMPLVGLAVSTFSEEFKPVEMDFLWEPYFPKGKCILLDASGGTGKTSLMASISAMMSNGLTPVTGEPTGQCVKTLYLHQGEDQSEEIETIYRACGGKPGGMLYYDVPFALDNRGVKSIEETIVAHGIGLVVVDALFYFLVSLTDAGNNAMEILPVMQRMNAMAARTGVCVVNIRHTVKGGGLERAASDLGMGSVQFRNSHRGQLVARRHPEDWGLVVVTDEKGSLLVQKGDPFGYRRIGNAIEFVPGCGNPFEKEAKELPRDVEADAFVMKELMGRFVSIENLMLYADALSINPARIRQSLKRVQHQVKMMSGAPMLHIPAPPGYDPFAGD